MANKIHEVKSMQGKVKFKEVNGKFYRIKKDGTVAKEATGRNSLLVQQILNKTKPKKSEPSHTKSLHASYYTPTVVKIPKKPKSKKQNALTMLATVKKAKAAVDAKKREEKKPIVVKKEKSSNIRKGEAQASTLGDKKKLNKTTVVKKKEDKKKEKKNNLQKFRTKGGDSVIEGAFKTPKNKTQKKLKDLRKIEIKSYKTKKADMSNIIKKNGKKTVKPKSRLDAKGNYKGTNIKPTKLQLERLKRRGLA